MAKAQQARRTASVIPLRRPATLDMVRLAAPSTDQIEHIVRCFGLSEVDGDGIRRTHHDLIVNTAGSLADGLGERAMEIHLQRIVGAFVGSAHGAGQFYSKAVSEARDMTTKLANDERDEDRDGPVGFESQAQRKREFAADMALQAFCLRMAAEGAVEAYAQVIGEAWKPFDRPETGPSVDRQAAQAQMAAFG